MAAARLRKTFQYPEEDSEEDETDRGLDEQEQEQIIEQMRQEDYERNKLYKRIILILPIISALTFLPSLVTSKLFQVQLVSFLCIVNLATTAYTLLPDDTSDSSPSIWPIQKLGMNEADANLPKYRVEYLNGILSIILGINSFVLKDRQGASQNFWILCLLPAGCLGVIVIARRLMASVDIGELEKLKYRNKGA